MCTFGGMADRAYQNENNDSRFFRFFFINYLISDRRNVHTRMITVIRGFSVFINYVISDRRNLHRDSRHWPLLVRRPTFTRRVISLMKPAFFFWGFAGRIAMLLPSRVAGRTLGLHGPDLAHGPEVAPRCST